ncbi:MAG: sigma-54-dependent Fis family transcriptional regulator [Bacteroidetes bacterium]|nr:sigma-54-dependent Fis family transcriptional regulator [Bacteroidota bacterium]
MDQIRQILIVDDEEHVRYSLRKLLKKPGFEIMEATNGLDALRKLESNEPDLMLMDIEMPGMNGLEAIQKIKALYPSLPVIIITAYGTTERVIAAMKYGAFEYLEKPFDIMRLQALVSEALEIRRLARAHQPSEKTGNIAVPGTMIGESPAMKEVFKMIGRVAASDVSVLITGESGTGKELVAKAIHQYSDRSSKPFVAINCAAIPENLLESELFGHEKGAFTDAHQAKAGKFEQAEGGTLFLDEIGDMSLSLQAKLLRVLQDNTFQRLGSNKILHSSTRIISATNKNLENAIAQGKFREDLFYRLKVIAINIPPLRVRRDDIAPLTFHFLNRYSAEMKKTPPTLPAESMDLLLNHHWPGNVRELENLMKRLILLSKANVITPEQISAELSQSAAEIAQPKSDAEAFNPADAEGKLYDLVIGKAEEELIRKTLTWCKGNLSKTSKMLGISRAMLYERMNKYGINTPDDHQPN